MATQLHYYGSVFDLDENPHGGDFVARLGDKLDVAARERDGAWARFELVGGGTVDLLLRADTHLAVVRQ
ncbi:hypothetical protein [Microbacterium hydrocarbonoxydans]|uniref:hypothetical protein n=1 Tax=Microbacterium hydrocarbonoxydans TaxID=273678 RepID=UPI003D98C972